MAEDEEMMSTANAGEAPADEEAEPGVEEQTLSKDDMFHILQNERRRRVLEYLADKEGPEDMRDIAEQVAAWEHDTTVQALSSDQRQRVYIALYQSHLPKLADFGLITYNRSRGIVERTPLADQVNPYLDAGKEEDVERPAPEEDWLLYYAGATAVSVGLILLAWAGVPVLGTVAGLGIAVLITLIYAGITAAVATSARSA